MDLCRTKCLHFPTTLWNGTNTREDGKNFVSNTYLSNLDNQPLYCVYSSLSPSSMQRGSVHTQFLFTFASLNWKKLFFVRVKWAYCDTSVLKRGSKLLCRWSARDVTHALPANVVPKNYSNWKWELQAEFNVFGCLFYWRTVQFKSECLYECLIYFFRTQKRSKETKIIKKELRAFISLRKLIKRSANKSEFYERGSIIKATFSCLHENRCLLSDQRSTNKNRINLRSRLCFARANRRTLSLHIWVAFDFPSSCYKRCC